MQSRFFSKPLLLLSVFLACSFNRAVAQEDVNSKSEEQLAYNISLFEALISQLQVIEQGDVFVELTETSDTIAGQDQPEKEVGLAMLRVTKMRMVFDNVSGEMLFLRRHSYVGVTDNADEETFLKASVNKESEETVGLAINSDGVFARIFPNPTYLLKGAKREETLRDFQVPDIRTVGLVPMTSNSTLEKMIVGIRKMTASNISSSSDLGDDRRRVTISLPRSEESVIESSFEFDTENCLLLKRSTFLVKPLTKKRYKNAIDSVKWEEIEGVFVPVRLRSETAHFFKTAQGQKGALVDSEMAIKWFSVNQKAAAELFDKKNLDEEMIDKLLQPPPEQSEETPKTKK